MKKIWLRIIGFGLAALLTLTACGGQPPTCTGLTTSLCEEGTF